MRGYSFPVGRVEAHGYILDISLSEENICQRVLSLWQPESKLYKTPIGFILIQSKPEAVFVEQCLGSPLMSQQGQLSNVIWEDNNETYHNSKILALWRGKQVEINIDKTTEFDPSLWFSLEHYSESQLKALGKVKKPQVNTTSQEKNMRAILKDPSLTESDQQKQTIKTLANIGTHQQGTLSGGGSKLDAVSLAIQRILKPQSSTYSQGLPEYSNQRPSVESKGLFSRIKMALREMAAHSALGKAIGEKQAKYLQNMMDQFHSGNLDEALRNAIPLGSLQDALDSKGTALGKLTGIGSTIIRPYAKSGGGSVRLQDEILDQLRAIYENAFLKMDREGNVKKAAFILAELLKDIDRAVTYLEKHGEGDLAAQLAEGQRLPPSRVIRQWILAGNIERAITVAKVSGCYEEAITALSSEHPDAANKLRWHCAQLQYKAGNISTAIEIAWPIEKKRHDVLQWLREYANVGGTIGARHLVRLANHDPDNYQLYLEKINAVLKSGEFQEHLSVFDEIIANGHTLSNSRIASIASRSYLIEVSKGTLLYKPKLWNQLCNIAGDLSLRADIRNLHLRKSKQPVKLVDAKTQKEFSFKKAGGRSPLDCAIFANGAMLCAFGEAGAELRDQQGKLLTHISAPCTDIICSDEGFNALLLARRSGYQVIHKFDIKSRECHYWLTVSVDQWAQQYDGMCWLIANGDSIRLLDTGISEQTIIWNVSDMPGTVVNIERSEKFFSVCLQTEEGAQIWTYTLPNLYLKERQPFQTRTLKENVPSSHEASELLASAYAGNESTLNKQFIPMAFQANGVVTGTNDEGEFAVYSVHGGEKWHKLNIIGEVSNIQCSHDFIILTSHHENSTYLQLFPIKNYSIRTCVLSINFNDTRYIRVRIAKNMLLAYSDDGRLIVVDLEDGKIVKDILV